MDNKTHITADAVRELVEYNPDTGEFTWKPRPAEMFRDGYHDKEHDQKTWNSKNAGRPAGFWPRDGYRRIGFFGRAYLAHRIAWLYVYGDLPNMCVDHINNDPSDNRISNLRLSTKAENCRNSRRPSNNTSGVKGVTWCKQSRKWTAQITLNRKVTNLGRFSNIDEAAAAYAAAARELHGEFARIE